MPTTGHLPVAENSYGRAELLPGTCFDQSELQTSSSSSPSWDCHHKVGLSDRNELSAPQLVPQYSQEERDAVQGSGPILEYSLYCVTRVKLLQK